VEQAASHARQIEMAIEEHGVGRVEAILDAALALERHIDVNHRVQRPLYPEYESPGHGAPTGEFSRRFAALDVRDDAARGGPTLKRAALPPHPERDLLWFIAHYAPELEGWERDIFLAVREESFYFHPVYATQIMNEGWASYWHARLLREAAFLPQSAYIDAVKCHSDVVRPIASGEKVALQINPYHLGFSIWDRIMKEQGLEGARRIMTEDDDASFVRNHLSAELAAELELFRFNAEASGAIKVMDTDLDALHEAIIAPKFNFGAPAVTAAHVRVDGTLELTHDAKLDGRGLDSASGSRVLAYIEKVWRRPVILHSIDERGAATDIKAAAA